MAKNPLKANNLLSSALMLGLLCFTFLASAFSFAQASVDNAILWPIEGGKTLRSKLRFYSDSENQFHSENLPGERLFKPAEEFRHAATNNAIWVTFSIREMAGRDHEAFLINNDSMFDVIDIYERKDNGSYQLAMKLGDIDRDYAIPELFQIHLKSYEIKEYLIKLRHSGTFNLPISLLSDYDFYENIIEDTIVKSAFYATLIALIAVYFIVVRQHINRSDIYFLTSSLLAGMCFAHIDGLFHTLSDRHWIKHGNLELFTYPYVMCWALFVKTFTNIESESPRKTNDKLCRIFFYFGLMLSGTYLFELYSGQLPHPNRIYVFPVIAAFILLIISVNLRSISYRTITIVSSGIPCIGICFYLFYNDVFGMSQEYDNHIVARVLYVLNLLFAVYILSKQSVKRVQQQLQSEQRKRLDDIKVIETDQLINNIASSLRTPLNGLTGMIDLIRNTKLEGTQRHCVDIIDRSGAELVRLIDNFEDYNSNSSRFTEEIHETFSLEDCIISSCQSYSQQAINKNLELLYDPKYDTSHKFVGDPIKIRKVVSRLLENAVNFSSNDDINIISTLSQPEANGEVNVVVWVENRISNDIDEHIDNINSFFNATADTQRMKGLEIAQQLLHSIDGELKFKVVNNLVSIGFSVGLEPAPRTLRTTERSLSDYHCLIIAPKSKRIELLEKQLEEWKMRSSHISNIEIIDKGYLERHDFDCCIVDMDCKFTYNYINNHFMREFHNSLPPAVFISYTLRQPNVTLENFRWDTKCLAKPMHRDKLKLALKKLAVSIQSNDDDYVSISNTAPPSSGFNLSLDINTDKSYQHHRVMVAEDNAVNRQVMRSLLNRLSINCDFRNNGYEVTTAICEVQRPYTVVLMDCDMPGIDGFEATKKIRQFEKRHALEAIHIIAVTSIGAKEQEDKARQCGMTSFIRKPVSLEMLRLEFDKLSKTRRSSVTQLYE